MNTTNTTYIDSNYNYTDNPLFILIVILILVTILSYGLCCETSKEAQKKMVWQQERARARIELRDSLTNL